MDIDPRLLWQDRLLERRPDLVRVEQGPNLDAIVRRDEILVAAADIADLEARSFSWVDRVHYDEDAMLARVKLRDGWVGKPVELANELNAEPGAPSRTSLISANHIFAGMPGSWGGGPASPPGQVNPAPKLTISVQRAVAPMTVAVVDTGVSDHDWFRDTAWWADVRAQDLEQLDVVPQDDYLDEQAGHGTFIIGVILQRAPETYIVANKLLSSDGVCDEFSVVRKLRRLKRWSDATGRRLDVVNLSFGGPTVDDQPPAQVADAVAALGPDTVVVACAGNDHTDRKFWPAALDGVIAVGALDSDGTDRAPFSNFGDWVDACAIGERVSSSFVKFDGPLPSTGDFDDDEFTGYATWSGTSFAAPAVAGAIVALAMERGIPATEAAKILLDPATHESRPGVGVVVAAA
jgi:subtilisin family serine protease